MFGRMPAERKNLMRSLCPRGKQAPSTSLCDRSARHLSPHALTMRPLILVKSQIKSPTEGWRRDQTLILPERLVEGAGHPAAREWAGEKREIRGSPVSLFQLISDFSGSLKRSGFWLYSSWIEVLLSCRSTFLGPLWILLGTLTFVFFV